MKKLILTAGLVIFTVTLCFADTIVVDCNGGGDYLTIQAGIDAASNGDVVWVLDGVYSDYEDRDLHWQNKHITVRSVYGPDDCIIKGGGYGDYYRAFNLTDSSINNDDLIYGFTIRDFGFNQYSGINKGAVILCDNGASPTISNCIIEDCTYDNQTGPDHYGLGIAIYCEGNTVVEDCIIRNNQGIAVEGGIAIACKGDVTIKNNEIYGNSTKGTLVLNPPQVDLQGIAIYILADENNSPTIDNNVFYNNYQDDDGPISSGEGSLIYSEFDISWNYNDDPIEITNNRIYNNTPQNLICLTDNAEITICNNLIYENTCQWSSSAICIGHCPPYSSSNSYTIDNNTIVDNDCYAALHLVDSGYYYGIYNNIIAFNDGYGIRWNTGTERLVVGYSNLYENSSGNYDTTPEELGCIYEDPLFTDPDNGDYSLLWNTDDFSPCIDTGDPNSTWDADDTPPDMGAIPAIAHDYFVNQYDGEVFDRIEWISFPALNRTTNGYTDALNVLERQSLIFPGYPNDDILDHVLYENYQVIRFYNGEWQNTLGDFDSRQGYKFVLQEGYDDIPMKGISGTWENESTPIQLYASKENWVGCFLNESAYLEDAFESISDEWTEIRSEHWAVSRQSSEPTPHIRGTVNPGELYIIRVENDCELIWDNSGGGVEPYIREKTDYFTYEETVDYMAIDIDTVYTDTTVAEIAIFSDDQCLGASKVYDDEYPVQILAYTPETMKNGNNGLEFKLYFEGQKGQLPKSIPYVMYNKEVQAFITQPLYYKRNTFATVQLNTNESSYTQQITLMQNFPNPVITNTTQINFMPEQKAQHTELNIYNLKGQLIRTIDCDVITSSGTKNGYYTLTWDCRDINGKGVKNGIYFYKLTSGEKSTVNKMLIMK